MKTLVYANAICILIQSLASSQLQYQNGIVTHLFQQQQQQQCWCHNPHVQWKQATIFTGTIFKMAMCKAIPSKNVVLRAAPELDAAITRTFGDHVG
jgi:hypothetical protein